MTTSTNRLYFKRVICSDQGNGVICYKNGYAETIGFGKTLATQLKRAINCNGIKSLIHQGAHSIYDLRLSDALVLSDEENVIGLFGYELIDKVYTKN
jgi:hypothetical protein